jgi:two-component system OmpR family response regulator
MSPDPLILLVEDEADIRTLLVDFLGQQDYRVVSAVDFPEGNAILRAMCPELVITNVRLPGGDGRELQKQAQTMNIPVLLISAHPQDIATHGDVAFLPKPFRLRDLGREVERLLA